jgi:acyl dehydratase
MSIITIESLEELIGQPFPSGSFTIVDYEHWLTADAVLSPVLPPSCAHPMYAYYVAVAGMGMTLDELFALVGSSAEDGPMFGEAGIEFHQQLHIGATYRVEGGITAVARKEGRRAGIFDIVTFELRLFDEMDRVTAVTTNSFVFPRRVA